MQLNDPVERSLLAGEYALGTLLPDERRELESAAARQLEVRADITWWEYRLAGLGLKLTPIAPRPIVWLNLLLRIGETTATPVAARPVAFWKTWASLATAASLVLTFALYRQMTRPPPEPVIVTQRVEVPVPATTFVALLQVPGSSMAWSVSLTPDRRQLAVRAAGKLPDSAAGTDCELWWIAESGPVSLGVIPMTGEVRRALPSLPFAAGGTVAVSLEPQGGSPTGQPTGPLIVTGQVFQAG